MRKSSPNEVVWPAECDRAFQALKKALCSAPVLTSPDFTKRFVLQTNALDRGVGVVLSQCDEKGQDQPIAYYSRKHLPREERYSTIEKECLAIKLSIQAFNTYLMGRTFTIQTDHRSLEWLNRTNARLTRWSLFLQGYSPSLSNIEPAAPMETQMPSQESSDASLRLMLNKGGGM